MSDYDVVIAGGGMAGLITAASIGYHSKGKARTLIIDRNPEQEPGKKTHNGWTCGDATSQRSLDYLAEHIGVRYGSPELEHPVKGVYVYSPDRKTKVLFEGEGWLFNRKIAPRRQVNDAKRYGTEFMFGATVEKLLYDGDFVTGVSGRKSDGSAFTATGKIVIDATGSSSVLRRFLTIRSFIEKEIDGDDVVGTGRYILDFEPAKEAPEFFTPDYCIIHLDQFMAPAGYAWVFPKGKTKVNIGLGISKSGLERRNRRLGLNDNLQSLIDKYVADNPVIKNAKQPQGESDSGNTKGNWQVPVRRHNDCMVANGFAVVGDAAWMPRPIDAGGISPSIYGGTILGKVVAEALEAGDTSESFALEVQRRVHEHARIPNGELRGPEKIPPDGHRRTAQLRDEALPFRGGRFRHHRKEAPRVQQGPVHEPRRCGSGSSASSPLPGACATLWRRARAWSTSTWRILSRRKASMRGRSGWPASYRRRSRSSSPST